MSISAKIKAINNKIQQNKVQSIQTYKLLRILLCHQEILLNINFGLAKMFYPKKICQKKLQQSKDLNILCQANNCKKETSVTEKQYQKIESAFESNKNEEDKTKKVMLPKIQSTIIILLFTNIAKLMNFLNILQIQNKMI